MTSDVLYIHQTQLNILLEWELHLHTAGWYLIAGKFHVVQNFQVFQKHAGNAKIKLRKFQQVN